MTGTVMTDITVALAAGMVTRPPRRRSPTVMLPFGVAERHGDAVRAGRAWVSRPLERRRPRSRIEAAPMGKESRSATEQAAGSVSWGLLETIGFRGEVFLSITVTVFGFRASIFWYLQRGKRTARRHNQRTTWAVVTPSIRRHSGQHLMC